MTSKIQQRLDNLTKPQGSLGRLEELILRYLNIRDCTTPRKALYVFCADHGVVAEGVSKYPQAVTRQMVQNFIQGGAAINVLCRHYGIQPKIVDVGVIGDPIQGALNCRVADGTRNMAQEPAMTPAQFAEAIDVGRSLALEASQDYDIAGLGEMGIGNTTAAAAVLAFYSKKDPAELTGPGTGLDPQAVRHKADVIRQALSNATSVESVAGFEIAAIAGFLIGAHQTHLPVVLDGFPCSAAALIAKQIEPNVLDTAFFSHRSKEPGHSVLCTSLESKPYFDLEMRLGEGTGAALLIGLLDAALRLYSEMATFGEAQVSTAELS